MGVAATRACGTYKIAHAIRRQGIVVIRKLPLVRPAGRELAAPDPAYAAKAGSPFRDLAPVVAQGTGPPVFISRGLIGQTISQAASGVDPGNLQFYLRKITANAVCAETDDIGNRLC